MSARRAAWAAVWAAFLVAAPSASAASFTVTDPADAGPGTLRDAVETAAPATPEADTIAFAPSLPTIGLAATVTVTSPVSIQDSEADVEIRSTAASPLLRFAAGASGSTVRGVSLTRAGGVGAEVVAGVSGVLVRAAPRLAALEPVLLAAGANGGIAAPQAQRVVRRRDGTLGLTGTSAGGTIDLYRGAPAEGSATFFGETPVGAGPFVIGLTFPAAPGDLLTTLLTGASGTAAAAPVRVQADLVSPALRTANGVGQTQVRAYLTEAVDPASVQVEDFALTIAGVERPVTAVEVGAGGASVLVTSSSSWLAGEAGFVRLSTPGAIADVSGNESAATDTLRVAASPGDVVQPLASKLKVSPRSLCLTRGARCRRAGAMVSFVATEEARVSFVVQRGNRRIGARRYRAKLGANSVRFDGRVRGRKLRQGTYRLLVYLEDSVGNQTEDPPLQRFSVRRTTERVRRAPAPEAAPGEERARADAPR